MHYRRIDPQPVTGTEMVEKPADMPTAELVVVAGEWYWRAKTAKN